MVVGAAFGWLAAVALFQGFAHKSLSIGVLLLAGGPLFLAYRYAPGLARVSLPKPGESRWYHSDPALNVLEQAREAREHSDGDRGLKP